MSIYSNMKESGIDWIGAVPSHWAMHTLYQLVSPVKAKNKDLSEKNLLSLSYGKIKRKNIEDTEGLLPESFDGYNIIEAGDVVLRLTDLQNDHTSLRVGLVTERGIITSAYTTLRPSENCVSKYLYYLLHSFDIRKGFYGMGSGVRQGLNYNEVKELRIVLPHHDEQEAIVSYLDEQCALIDEALTEAQSSIADYKAWKVSTIFHAITKGIEIDRQKKDSHVDIIGEIPDDWEVRKLRFLCSVMTGNRDTQDSEEDGKYPFYVRSPIVERSNDYTYEGEGILMAGDGAGAGRVFHHAHGKYAIHQRVYCFHDFQEIMPRYFYYFMENLFSVEMDKGSAKSTVPSVRMPMLLNFNICLPPMFEQQKIVQYLDTITAQVDDIINIKESLISSLESYKRSLIYEVVTGKRKVVQ